MYRIMDYDRASMFPFVSTRSITYLTTTIPIDFIHTKINSAICTTSIFIGKLKVPFNRLPTIIHYKSQ